MYLLVSLRIMYAKPTDKDKRFNCKISRQSVPLKRPFLFAITLGLLTIH